MQRLGGGGYTRRRKQRGAGNDPSCGCDMQAGWPKFLTENIPLPSMKGGASCGIPPIPNYYNGRGLTQQGGSCGACAGLPLPQPLQSGGGQPTVYNSNPVPDACPFPGTGYCNFYARGGANPISFSGAVQHNNGSERTFHGTFNNAGKTRAPRINNVIVTASSSKRRSLSEDQKAKLAAGRKAAALERKMAEYTSNVVTAPVKLPLVENNEENTPPPSPVYSESPALTLRPLPFKGKRYLWDPERSGLWLQKSNGSKGEWSGKISQNKKSINTTAKNYTAQGGANYGEPMNLQARLKGGANNNEVPLGHMLMNQKDFLAFLMYYNRPFPHQLRSGKPKSKQFDEIYQAGKELMNAKVKNLDELRALQWIQDKKNGKPMLSPQEPLNTPAVGVGSSTVPRHKSTAVVQQGGANYGEPMYLQAKLRGGNVGPSHPTKGAGCGCLKGGYKPTKKNLNALKRWKRGESIGFTQTASLKAKGLIPRTSRKYRGKKVVSAKYK